ncbi:HNH endonuclease [Pseudoalteromonas piscicida]
MQLFFHDVGLKGAQADFPKTIFGDIAISDIVESCPIHLKQEVEELLTKEFPDGWCNAWGVPEGAKSVIRQLSNDDVMLLIKTTGGDGDIPVLCHVKGFWKEPLLELSKFLWGSSHFPYVFFFKTQEIQLTWTQFKQDVQYMPNFRPSGNVYRVKSERLSEIGGVQNYLKKLSGYKRVAHELYEIREVTPEQEYNEGERHIRETAYFKRNPQLVNDAKKAYGYTCQVCDFNFEEVYGAELGKEFIECHHKNPLSEKAGKFSSTLEDVCVVCSNCHRMLHRTKPAMKPERLRELFKK